MHLIIGAIFMKFGRAPATQRIGALEEYGMLVFIFLSRKRQTQAGNLRPLP